MSHYGTMQVVDGSGWSKTFPLEKALTMIGSASFNDVVLPEQRGEGVAAVHLQLVRAQTGGRGFRLVNLVNEPLSMNLSRARGAATLPPNASRDLEDGDAVRVGGFIITFYLQLANGLSMEKRSENLGIRLEMPGVTLRPGVTLAGLLTVSNYGEEKRSQFEIDLEGLPSDCYQIDPAPLLYPGGEEKLQIRFYHRGIRPPAGECPICLRATAIGAYPTEELVLPLVLDVAPVYRARLELVKSLEPSGAESGPIPQPLSEPDPAPQDPAPAPAVPAVSAAQATRPPAGPPPSAGTLPAPPPLEIPVFPDWHQEEAAGERSWPSTPALSAQEEPVVVERPVAEPPRPTKLPVEPAPAEPEVDWWAESAEELSVAAPSDPLAALKRGAGPKLSVEKSNIQVLKATAEDLNGQEDGRKSDE